MWTADFDSTGKHRDFWREKSHYPPRREATYFPFGTSSRCVFSSPKMPAESCVLRFAKLSEHAFAPSKGSLKAAGFDLKR